MAFQLEVNMDSDLFTPNYNRELSRILRVTADRIHKNILPVYLEDINGKNVGHIRLITK